MTAIDWSRGIRRSGFPSVRKRVRLRDGGRCRYCGEPATHLDHVVPFARGGQSIEANLVCACDACGKLKGDRTLAEAGMSLIPADWNAGGG